jgi:NADH-quinone oxidoreductase subunit L
MTHAFFKALLFLSAGVVIQALGHERDMTRMGGLRLETPIAFWTFLAGAASLSALPLVTAGYYSKDLIMISAFSFPKGGTLLWLGSVVGALLTSMYAFRMVFLTFFGKAKTPVRKKPGRVVQASLLVLAALAVFGGFIDVPGLLSHRNGLFPPLASPEMAGAGALLLKAVASLASLAGIGLAYQLYLRSRESAARISGHFPWAALGRFWFGGWGFDRLYDTLIVRPYLWISYVARGDFPDLIFEGMAWYSRALSSVLVRTQSGRIHHYALGIVVGAVITVGIVLFV